MRNIGWIVLLLVALFLLLSDTDCSHSSAQVADPTDLSSYFPVKAGMMWNYRITLGPSQPLVSRLYSFPATRDTLFQLVRCSPVEVPAGLQEQDCFSLILQVTRPVEMKLGGLLFRGVQLRVVTDDLGLYLGKENCLYWAITESGGQMEVIELITCFPDDPLVADLLPKRGLGQGFAAQYLFAGDRTGIGSGVGVLKSNILCPDDWYGELYQLVRTCHSEEEEKLLYREQLLFRKGEGLVRLVQVRGDTLTMEWVLQGIMHG